MLHTIHPGQLSLAIPSWVGAMSTSQKGGAPCGWGVKAGSVRVWVAGESVSSPCYTRPISELFRVQKQGIKPSLLAYVICNNWRTECHCLL